MKHKKNTIEKLLNRPRKKLTGWAIGAKRRAIRNEGIKMLEEAQKKQQAINKARRGE